MANFQRDGQMAFFNQGARPNYLSSIDPIAFRERSFNLDKVHGEFTGKAVTFLSEIRPEDFNAPRALWEKVFDEPARERFISNISGHMENCTDKEIIKRVISIFREVSEDVASRMEKATGVTGYPGIAELTFNGSLNGMAKDSKFRPANGVNKEPGSNGAPIKGTHAEFTNQGQKQ
jgi:catalase